MDPSLVIALALKHDSVLPSASTHHVLDALAQAGFRIVPKQEPPPVTHREVDAAEMGVTTSHGVW